MTTPKDSASGAGRKKKRGRLITEDRALQILNNISEEYADHGLTNFATKMELCETVMILRRMQWEEDGKLRLKIHKALMILATP